MSPFPPQASASRFSATATWPLIAPISPPDVAPGGSGRTSGGSGLPARPGNADPALAGAGGAVKSKSTPAPVCLDAPEAGSEGLPRPEGKLPASITWFDETESGRIPIVGVAGSHECDRGIAPGGLAAATEWSPRGAGLSRRPVPELMPGSTTPAVPIGRPGIAC